MELIWGRKILKNCFKSIKSKKKYLIQADEVHIFYKPAGAIGASFVIQVLLSVKFPPESRQLQPNISLAVHS